MVSGARARSARLGPGERAPVDDTVLGVLSRADGQGEGGVVTQPGVAWGVVVGAVGDMVAVARGDERVVDAVSGSAAPVPGVLDGVWVEVTVGVGEAGAGEGGGRVVLPAAEHGVVGYVVRLDEVRGAGDDDGSAGGLGEGGQRRGHCLLEGALGLVASVAWAAGGHVRAGQCEGVVGDGDEAAGARCGRWARGSAAGARSGCGRRARSGSHVGPGRRW